MEGRISVENVWMEGRIRIKDKKKMEGMMSILRMKGLKVG